MNQPTAYTENEMTPTITITRKDKLPPKFWFYLAILILVILAGRILYNEWRESKELKQIRTEKQAVSDTIDNIVTGIKQKAKQSVKTQRTLQQDYKAFVPVIVETDSANEAFYLRDSIKDYSKNQ